ncbi:acyl-CoA-binding domain-containing protein 3-like [Impatiens glandulifera]|uniref:acyl-CoA-binding domain-containing protein 3-like n=1 Tax=Impatiens glandulifera TaxID=253017 RepID=UPI001FB137E5|nr:acyl-CoA-binding domain-containing protein 3-like [Impatiens glandulifera]
MDSFQDLLSCVGATVLFSLLVSFVITKLLTMESARDQTSLSTSLMMQQKSIKSQQSKTKGESFILDWICVEQSFYSKDGDQLTTGTVVESPLGHVLSEMKNEAYDMVELLNPDEIKVGDDDFVNKVLDESSDSQVIVADNLMDLKWEGESQGDEEDWEMESEEDEEDWEGVERSDLEKRFGDAMMFVGSMNNASNIANLDNDDKLQLYALGMIVLEGPYILPQPISLKISSRAKWNALRKLRHMNREMAMDRYISLLSKNFPDWSSRKIDTTNVSSYFNVSPKVYS